MHPPLSYILTEIKVWLLDPTDPSIYASARCSVRVDRTIGELFSTPDVVTTSLGHNLVQDMPVAQYLLATGSNIVYIRKPANVAGKSSRVPTGFDGKLTNMTPFEFLYACQLQLKNDYKISCRLQFAPNMNALRYKSAHSLLNANRGSATVIISPPKSSALQLTEGVSLTVGQDLHSFEQGELILAPEVTDSLSTFVNRVAASPKSGMVKNAAATLRDLMRTQKILPHISGNQNDYQVIAQLLVSAERYHQWNKMLKVGVAAPLSVFMAASEVFLTLSKGVFNVLSKVYAFLMKYQAAQTIVACAAMIIMGHVTETLDSSSRIMLVGATIISWIILRYQMQRVDITEKIVLKCFPVVYPETATYEEVFKCFNPLVGIKHGGEGDPARVSIDVDSIVQKLTLRPSVKEGICLFVLSMSPALFDRWEQMVELRRASLKKSISEKSARLVQETTHKLE